MSKEHEAHTEHEDHSNHDHSGHDHSGHDHHDHGDMVTDFKKRFFISLIITIPILIMSPMIQSFIGVDWRFANDQYIVFALATFVFFYCCLSFITIGIDELKYKNPGMMLLIVIDIIIV